MTLRTSSVIPMKCVNSPAERVVETATNGTVSPATGGISSVAGYSNLMRLLSNSL